MSAYLINHPNKNNRFVCNICSDVIDNNKIIGLKCNVKKHVFCYDCIFDWYSITKKNMKSNINSNYNFIRMCPICRKNGGYLPNLNNNYCKEIHNSEKLEDIVQTCGYQLKNKEYCMSLGKKCYNNLCKKHYNIDIKKNGNDENNINSINPNRKSNEINEVISSLEKQDIFLNFDDKTKINIIYK